MAMLCIRTPPFGPGLPSPAEIIFGREIQSILHFVLLTKLEDEIRDDLHQLCSRHISMRDRQ